MRVSGPSLGLACLAGGRDQGTPSPFRAARVTFVLEGKRQDSLSQADAMSTPNPESTPGPGLLTVQGPACRKASASGSSPHSGHERGPRPTGLVSTSPGLTRAMRFVPRCLLGIGPRTPEDTKIHGCPNPLQPMAWSWYMSYTHPPLYLKSFPDEYLKPYKC